jgi:hypothetical protein
MLYPANLPYLDNFYYISSRISPVCSFLQPPTASYLFVPNIFSSAKFSITLILLESQKVMTMVYNLRIAGFMDSGYRLGF